MGRKMKANDDNLLIRALDPQSVISQYEDYNRLKQKYASKGDDLKNLVEREFFDDPRHIKLWDEFEIKVRGELSVARLAYDKNKNPMYHREDITIYRNGHRLTSDKQLKSVMWELADNKGEWVVATTEQEIKALVGINKGYEE